MVLEGKERRARTGEGVEAPKNHRNCIGSSQEIAGRTPRVASSYEQRAVVPYALPLLRSTQFDGWVAKDSDMDGWTKSSGTSLSTPTAAGLMASAEKVRMTILDLEPVTTRCLRYRPRVEFWYNADAHPKVEVQG